MLKQFSIDEKKNICLFNKRKGSVSKIPFNGVKYEYYKCNSNLYNCTKLNNKTKPKFVDYYCQTNRPALIFMSNPGKNKFTNIYDISQNKRFGSVNAGDNDLYVGGSNINYQFSQTIYKPFKYKDIHTNILNKKGITKIDYDKTDDLNFEKYNDSLKYTYFKKKQGINGTVFLHIFKGYFPNLDKNNISMIYVVPPKGDLYESVKKFLEDIKITAKNIGSLVTLYNNQNKDDSLEVVRVCLFSGGLYKHEDATKRDVARNIIEGLLESTKVFVTYEFAYDNDEFRKAYNNIVKAYKNNNKGGNRPTLNFKKSYKLVR
jgi:hypothetical protein